MAKNPHDGRPGGATRNEALEQAKYALDTGRPADAERIAADILRANAGNRDAAKLLGYALIMLDRIDEAIAVLERAARGSHDAELETQLGIALRRRGRVDDAIRSLERAIKRKPPFAAAFYELGPLLASLQRFDDAIDVLKRGVAAAPMMPNMLVQLGHAYAGTNSRKEAAECFRRALAMNPAHAEALQSLGVVLINDHNYAEAADLFRGIVASDPADTNARINLASSLLGLGNTDVAYACLRAVNEKGPQFYGPALRVLVASKRGRFFLRPSAAARFLKGGGR
jgi:tetratricopeptide (TPR) repeat protein